MADIAHEWFGDEGLPPLVLAAGLGGGATWWEADVASLAQDYRVLTFDPRGIGASPGAPGDVAEMAADVVALLNQVEEPVGFVGLDLGGLVGLYLATDTPAKVARLMVVNGWGAMHPHTARCLSIWEGLLRTDPALAAEARSLFLYPPGSEGEGDAAQAPAPATLLAQIAAARAWSPMPYRLGLIEARTLCVGVDDDILVPAASAEALAALLPHGQFASFSTGAHALNVTRPQDFAARVRDWLR